MSRKRTANTENQIALDLGDHGPAIAPAANAEPKAVDTSGVLASLEQTVALLDQWQQADWLRPLDVGFARLILALSEEQGESPPPLVLLLAALTSHQVGRGRRRSRLAIRSPNPTRWY